MAIQLRRVRSLEDMQFNFDALAFALANISPDQISPGAIGANLINGDVMPRGGGSFTGPVLVPKLEVTGELKARLLEILEDLTGSSAEFSGNLKAAAVDAESITKAGDPVPITAAGVTELAGAISNPPTQAEVVEIRDKINELLAALRESGAIAS